MISGGITATGVIDGENGDNGYSSAVVQLYRRYAPTQVAPTPALPTGELIYTFATGVLSGATASFNGWSQQIPAASADTKLFVTQATAISQDATDEISVNDWSTPVEYVKDGTKGDNAAEAYVSPGSISVPCNNAGGVVAQVTKTLTFSMRIGTNVATITGVSVETLPAGVSIAAGSSAATKNITIGTTASASGMAAGVTFTITGSYGGKTYMATCTLALIGSKQGNQGDDAYTVKIEPADILFTQSTTKNSQGAYPLVDATKTATVTVKKGNSNDAVAHNTTIQGTPSGCTASVSGDIVTVTGVIGNYTEGSVTVRVAITNGPTFDLKLNVYYNLLGSWKEKVEGDTKTEVATSLSYAYIQDGQGVQTLEQIGTYTKSSTENISTITKKVDNGKNLLRNALSGSGSFGCSTAKNFTNNPSLRDTTVDYDGYITAAENYTYIFQSGITIERGKWYTVSFEAKSNQTNVGFCVFNFSGDGSVFSGDNCDTNFTPTTSGKKKSITFKVSGTGTVTVAISIKCAALRYPQLELGEAATAFDSGGTDISSRIKQEADHIEALVNDTGVDITHGKINLYADKVKFYKNKASATAGDPAKIWIDGSKGTLHAVDGEFEGTVKATNFFHNVIICGEETKAYCGALFFTLYSAEPWVNNFTLGGYYTKAEVQQLSNGDLGDFGYGMTKCTFDADIIVLPHGASDTGDASIDLPIATDFDGKLVEIVDTRYTQSFANPVGALTVSQCDGASKMRGNFGADPAQYVRLNGNNSHDGGNYRLLSYEGYWVKLSTVSNA